MNSKILHAALFTIAPEGSWGIPLLLWGAPGKGKTAFVKQAAARYDMAFERLSPAERGEGQWGVVPVPMADGLLHYPPPDWSKKFENMSGLAFVDEINTASPALQAPLLGFVQLRVLGSYTFGPRTRVIAAANETQDAAGGYDLAPALANRFGHYDFEGLSAHDWTTALIGGFANVDDHTVSSAELEEQRVKNAWPQAIATARGIVAGFIHARPELLYRQPSKAGKSASRAWPSNRTVEYATCALASSYVHGLSDRDMDEFMGGFVGDAWMGEFATYRQNLDLPDIVDLLDGRVKWKPDDQRQDRTMAVLSAGAALVIPENAEKRVDRAKALWDLLGNVMDTAPDLTMPAGHALIAAKLTQYGRKSLAKLFPVLQAAGLAQ